MMLIEAALSFLGLGVQPPMPSWGSMVSRGREYICTAWWLTTIPGVVLMLAVLGANQFGDGLQDLLDPRCAERVSDAGHDLPRRCRHHGRSAGAP